MAGFNPQISDVNHGQNVAIAESTGEHVVDLGAFALVALGALGGLRRQGEIGRGERGFPADSL